MSGRGGAGLEVGETALAFFEERSKFGERSERGAFGEGDGGEEVGSRVRRLGGGPRGIKSAEVGVEDFVQLVLWKGTTEDTIARAAELQVIVKLHTNLIMAVFGEMEVVPFWAGGGSLEDGEDAPDVVCVDRPLAPGAGDGTVQNTEVCWDHDAVMGVVDRESC